MVKQNFLTRTLLLFALIVGSTSVWGQEYDVAYTFSIIKPSSGAVSDYSKTGDMEIDGITWNVPGNWYADGQLRIGGKSIEEVDRIITGKNAISEAISKITVNHAGVNSPNLVLNSVTITVASDANFSNVVTTKTVTPTVLKNTSGSFELTPDVTCPANSYYKIAFNVTNAMTSNYCLTVNSIVFYKESTPVTKHTLSYDVSPAEAGSVTLGATEVGEGRTTTIAANANSGYRFKKWTVSGTGSSVENENEAETVFTMGTENATVTANFEVLQPITVTLSDGGSLTESSYGAGVTLPMRDDVGIYTFAGWSETNLSVETTTVTIIPAGEYHPTADITLYPVYKRTESSSSEVEVSVSIAEYASNNSWNNGTKYTSINIDSNITAEAAGGSNSGKYYSSGNTWRIYSSEDGTLTINAINGMELLSVALTFTGESSTKPATIKFGEDEITSGTAVNVSGNSAVFKVTGGQARITAIDVKYQSPFVTYYTSAPAVTETATITSAGYATFSSDKNVDFFANDGLTVYTAKVSDTSVTLNEVESKKVPANTAVVLKGEAGDYTGTIVASADALTNNDLKVATEDLNGDGTIYVLNKVNGKVGFYKLSTSGTLSKGKAYLKSGNAAPFLGFDGEDTTGIYSVERGALSVEGCYTLDGRRVAQPTKGLYIVNGKKVIIK